MGGRFPFTRLAKYPHMKPEDVAVWERFIDAHPGYFDTVDYDVAVGTGVSPAGKHDPAIEAGYQTLTQKKVDAIGYKSDRITIVEVKPIADMRALGQAITYSHLYAEDHPEAGDLTRLVVAGAIERDLAPIYATQGVEIEVA